MPGIRIIDKDTMAGKRRLKAWECFGRIGVNPTDLKDGKDAFYAIVKTEQIEMLLTEDAKKVFQGSRFEVSVPIEYSAMRSVIIRHVDKAVDEYTVDELKINIEDSNEWAKVEEVVKLGQTGRLLKIKFMSTQMALNAINNGMVVIYQWIPPKNIEKEIYIRLTPCYNCYSYNHKTKECQKDKQILCAFCGNEGHKLNQCKERLPRCINSDGIHRTLASICPYRKEVIRERAIEVRERSRSRSRRTQTGVDKQTYAQAAKVSVEDLDLEIDSTEFKDIITKIMTCIIYSQCTEVVQPGTFKDTVAEMFRLNGLPSVQFPKQKLNEGIKRLYHEMLQKTVPQGAEGGTDIDMRQKPSSRQTEKDIEMELRQRRREEEEEYRRREFERAEHAREMEREIREIREMERLKKQTERSSESAEGGEGVGAMMHPDIIATDKEKEKDQRQPKEQTETAKRGREETTPQKEENKETKKTRSEQEMETDVCQTKIVTGGRVCVERRRSSKKEIYYVFRYGR